MRQARVMVIDDDHAVRGTLVNFLNLRGYEALGWDSPTALCAAGLGTALCADGKSCCDALVTDVEMPGESGLDFLARQATNGCKIAARNRAVISGRLDDEGQQFARSLGAAFFRKPFALGALCEWLRECEARLDLRVPLATRRSEERFTSRREVVYRICPQGEPQMGQILNASASGLCLAAASPLQAGQVLHIEGSHVPTGRAARVRWVKPAGGQGFLVGLHIPLEA